jgi:uncharacterized membrane protein
MAIFNRLLSIILALSILAAMGMIGYILASPKVSERFTEFYLLGREGKAQDYPTLFTIAGDEVVSVGYGNGGAKEEAAFGKVLVGIVNHEDEESTYEVRVVIDGQPVEIYLDGKKLENIGSITLKHGEKWEHEVGFAPEKVGDRQRVVFVLYRDGAPCFEEPPYLWIDVKTGG